jgi:hypothetical protein
MHSTFKFNIIYVVKSVEKEKKNVIKSGVFVKHVSYNGVFVKYHY